MFQNETIEMSNDSYLEDVGQSTAGSGQGAVQQDNVDADNDADNDADLGVEAEPPMEQQVQINVFILFLRSLTSC